MSAPDTLVDWASAHAARAPRRVAIRHHDTQWSYAELREDSGRLAYLLLASGVGPGDRVGLMLPNVAQFVSWYYGVLHAGAVVVPLDPALTAQEAARRLLDADATTLIAWHDRDGVAREVARNSRARLFLVEPEGYAELIDCVDPIDAISRAAGDTGVVLYATQLGRLLRGVQLTHRNLAMNAAACASRFGLDAHTVTLGAVPLWRAFGQTCVLNATLGAGGCVTLLAEFRPARALEVIERDRVSVLEATPAMYATLVAYGGRHQFDTSSLRLCVCIGRALPDPLRHAFEDAFGLPIRHGYGRPETSPVTTFGGEDGRSRNAAAGCPIDGVEVRVVNASGRAVPAGEVGELHVRGHNVMKGYWRRPALTAQAIDGAGWLRTGDLAHVDEDGCVYVADRASDGAAALAVGAAV